MPDTLGSLKAEVKDWLEDTSIPESRYNQAINDGIESLWETLMRACLQMFTGGPVAFSVAAAAERVQLVSVVDPTLAPVLSAVTSGALPAHAVSAKYTLVTESGTETLPSPAGTINVLINEVGLVASPAFASNAIGWNCYALPVGAPIYVKRNDAPIPFGTPFQESDDGWSDPSDLPLAPVENSTADDICYIKHLEVQTDRGLRTFGAADLDSLMMQRAAGGVATSSPYQQYYWDLINQRQLEFRPAAGAPFAPRYFYIKRPRRLRFDNAPLPFLTVPSIAFLRDYALAALSLSVREFASATAWEAKAEQERMRAELAVVNMNTRPSYITPF